MPGAEGIGDRSKDGLLKDHILKSLCDGYFEKVTEYFEIFSGPWNQDSFSPGEYTSLKGVRPQED